MSSGCHVIFISILITKIGQMEKYINMNDSFGGENTVSSTKSFLSSYEQCIQNLTQQLENHKKALKTAEQLLEQYRKENQQLLEEIQSLQKAKEQSQQKYQILEKLFLRLDKEKEKQLKRQTKRSQEKHSLEIQNLNSRFESHIATLNERIYLLENQLGKNQQRLVKYQQIQLKFKDQTQKKFQEQLQKTKEKYQRKDNIQTQSNKKSKEAQYLHNDQNLKGLQQRTKLSLKIQKQSLKNQSQKGGMSDKSQLTTSRVFTVKKDLSQSRKEKPVKTIQFMRFNTEDEYLSQHEKILRTAQKQSNPPLFYNYNLTEHKRYI